MKKSVLVFLMPLLFVAVLVLSSCSDVQNREKENKKETVDKSTINLQVIEKSTTKDGQTIEGIEKNIESEISKSLSQVLIKGVEKKEIFEENSLEKAKSIFVDNSKAKANNVKASYFYLDTTDPNTSLIAVQFSQDITENDGSKNAISGNIYFNTEGKVLGFDAEKPESKASGK